MNADDGRPHHSDAHQRIRCADSFDIFHGRWQLKANRKAAVVIKDFGATVRVSRTNKPDLRDSRCARRYGSAGRGCRSLPTGLHCVLYAPMLHPSRLLTRRTQGKAEAEEGAAERRVEPETSRRTGVPSGVEPTAPPEYPAQA